MFSVKQIGLFWRNVDIRSENECWNWKLSVDRHGYGKVRIGGKVFISHRVAFMIEQWISTLDNEKEIMHSCDNRRCCNPNHLSEGTHTQNMQDMIRKGRQIKKGIPYSFKLDYEKAESIRKERKQGIGVNALSRKYRVDPKHIRDILNGICWK